ncbi:50S ribosomal protein L19 [Mesomycoplasma lagogenitalium]|uniref:Large ribosomal subunit protein bL19 n=1 Tax=Mesomycoplasma lagogenitalium TaxID=171286 RepID=A0ABY8LXB2_9BACT|nr:50S ribosomal protein L19 [Mesomycoplasma lagogenitalium]WGI36911.1 50S ribosomal protein L19 [Mesomycoplasma lagogenitalium]
MQNKLMTIVEGSQIRKDLPAFRQGDNVKVHVRIKEGNKERIQIFEGLVIARKNSGTRETFTVRKMSYGFGVERTFPVNSPTISSIEVVRSNKVRRAKLYFMRERKGKSARLKEIRRKK